MKSKLSLFFVSISLVLFSSYTPVPNTSTFSLFDVLDAVYGSHVSGNLADAFTASDPAKFDAVYGSKTMSPQTMLGFRNYGASTSPFSYISSNYSGANLNHPISKSIDISASSKLLVITFQLVTGSERTGGSPTYDGVEMLSANISDMHYTEMWYLINPPTGNNTLNIPNTTNENIQIISSWYNGSDNISYYGNMWSGSTGTSLASSATVPVGKEVLIVTGICLKQYSSSRIMDVTYDNATELVTFVYDAGFGSTESYKIYTTGGSEYTISLTGTLGNPFLWYSVSGTFVNN